MIFRKELIMSIRHCIDIIQILANHLNLTTEETEKMVTLRLGKYTRTAAKAKETDAEELMVLMTELSDIITETRYSEHRDISVAFRIVKNPLWCINDD